MNVPSNQIWAYLHNELSPEKRERFEEELQRDPDLREALEEQRATHKELNELLPLLTGEVDSSVEFEEELLSAWETAHPEYAEKSDPKPSRKIIRFSIPLAAAAAAAAVLLIMSPSDQTPVNWLKTNYGTTPQLRGQAGGTTHYSHTNLKEINQELQNAIENSLRQLTDTTKSWTLKVDLQELANGALAVEISGYPYNAKERSRVWSNSFDSLEDFQVNIPMLGSRIAEHLVEQNNL